MFGRGLLKNLHDQGFTASEEMSFENVDSDGRTTDAYLYYKLIYEPSGELIKNNGQTARVYIKHLDTNNGIKEEC